jgi:FkbM family methyltransferase
MLKYFFNFIQKIKRKNKFFLFITQCAVFSFFREYLHILKNRSYAQQMSLYYAQNAERVNAVANMLADERSKENYLGMIKFRQTGSKKDYPVISDETQYFIKELKLGKDEVFIDCGAFIGDTICDFLKYCPEYKQIAAFEPDSKNFENLKKKYGANSKITLINAGAYSESGEISFSELGNADSKIIEASNSAVNIQIKAIDDLSLEKVSFIKMDIEGAELKALKGAEKIIAKNKPKLAICIYHSNEDMLGIAEFIHNAFPEYKLYVRQHCYYPFITETVLYALPSDQ